MENKMQPEIRFPRFDGDWEKDKLGNIGKVYDGTHQTPTYIDNGVMFLSVENIKTLQSQKFISEEAFTSEFKIRPEKGDILMTRIGDIGTANVVIDDNPVAYYVSLALIKSEMNPWFLQANIQSDSFQSELWKKTLHIAFPKKINKNEIANVYVSFPSKKEQDKIGSFFMHLDKNIALHQQELATLKQTKQGFLQNMFPKEGEKVPEVRFPGFIDDWRQNKLSDVGSLNRGKSKHRPRNDPKLYGGKYPFIQTGDVAKAGLFLNKYHQTYSEYGIQQSKLWNKGTLLITIAANIAETSILDIKAAFPDSVIGFESDQVDMVFIKKVIDNASNTLKSKAETSSQANLNLSKLSELTITIPTFNEQQKIGSFFKQLDETITLHQHELELLQLTKKAFLQKLFV